MPKTYSTKPKSLDKSAKARGSGLRVHFKNTREAASAIRGLPLKKAQQFLKDVIARKQAVPFTRYNGGVGRHAQLKNHPKCSSVGRWPKKSAEFLLGLLKNAESNAENKKLNIDRLRITHIQVNKAQKLRRRTYRAHGRINAYMCSPSHIELIVEEKPESAKPKKDREIVKTDDK
eukprot:TRINITY_DN564_c0_g1_i1.p1 TRINITY_DN564_c0_g1~~TRINITY_DN564_c0_g1_i1.p1  ORF type:complete len:175 (+),score=31.66 TRINITY_DN564_c0_g1_i1:63-587(+)